MNGISSYTLKCLYKSNEICYFLIQLYMAARMLHVISMEVKGSFNMWRASVAYELPCGPYYGFNGTLSLNSAEEGRFLRGTAEKIQGNDQSSEAGRFRQLEAASRQCIKPHLFLGLEQHQNTFPSPYSPIWNWRTFPCSLEWRQPSMSTDMEL